MTIETQDKTSSNPSWSKDEEYQRNIKQPLEQSAELMQEAKDSLQKAKFTLNTM